MSHGSTSFSSKINLWIFYYYYGHCVTTKAAVVLKILKEIMVGRWNGYITFCDFLKNIAATI